MVDTQKIFDDLIAYLESLTEEEWMTPVSDEWTVKDIVSHLIGWNEEARKLLPKQWETGEIPWFMNTPVYEKFNEQYVLKHKNDLPSELIKTLEDGDVLFIEEINKIGEENLRKEMDKYYWVLDEGEDNHYLEHYNQIKTAVENKRAMNLDK